jgi:Mg-chelatase subunit ChlD
MTRSSSSSTRRNRWRKADAATDALVAFHETFSTLGVRHAIVEFAGTPTVLLEMGKTPNPKERDQILAGLRLKETGTDDYSALLKSKTLFSNNATRKLIVFITDGKGSNLQRRAVEHAEDHENIRTLGIHIGGGENAVAESYRHSTSQSNVRLVPRAMADFLLAHW